MSKILETLGDNKVIATLGFVYGVSLACKTKKDWQRQPLNTCVNTGISGIIYGFCAQLVGGLIAPYGAMVTGALTYSIGSRALTKYNS